MHIEVNRKKGKDEYINKGAMQKKEKPGGYASVVVGINPNFDVISKTILMKNLDV